MIKDEKPQKKRLFTRSDLVTVVIGTAILLIIFFIGFAVGYNSAIDKVPEAAVSETTECTSAPVTEASSVDETVIDILPTTEETIHIEETKPVPTEEIKPAGWVYDNTLKPEENIFIYLTDHLGYSKAASCGIIANIAYETGWKFNPDAGSPSRCYGLIQWLGGRLKKLKSWCKENGKDYNSIQGQLDFMDWELKNDDPYGTYKCLTEVADSSKGAYKAGWYFCYWFERPNNKSAASERRGNEAKKYYKMF